MLCHRDYHSRNLMLHESQLYIIAFQDARMGPDTYDLVFAAARSYSICPTDGQRADRVLPRAERRDRRGPRLPPPVRRHALQRNLKALGTSLPDDRETQPRVHPVHPAHSALRPGQPRQPAPFERLRGPVGRTSRSSAKAVYNWRFPITALDLHMRFGISTHLFHDQRLSRDHLSQIAARGFEAVEVFATRTHFDYHDPAAIAQLGQWLNETGLALHGIHAPIVESMGGADKWGAAISNAVGGYREATGAVSEGPSR